MNCSNSYYLQEHYFHQEQLEKEWEMNKSDNRDKVVELARKILLQECDTHTFDVAFGKAFIDVSEDQHEFLLTSLEEIELGICDEGIKSQLILLALDAAAFCLFDCELEEFYDHSIDLVLMVQDVEEGL